MNFFFLWSRFAGHQIHSNDLTCLSFTSSGFGQLYTTSLALPPACIWAFTTTQSLLCFTFSSLLPQLPDPGFRLQCPPVATPKLFYALPWYSWMFIYYFKCSKCKVLFEIHNEKPGLSQVFTIILKRSVKPLPHQIDIAFLFVIIAIWTCSFKSVIICSFRTLYHIGFCHPTTHCRFRFQAHTPNAPNDQISSY